MIRRRFFLLAATCPLPAMLFTACGGNGDGAPLSQAGKCSYEAGAAVVRPWLGTGGKKVLFIGDSIFDLWDIAAAFPAYTTQNQGGSGQCSTEVQARFQRDAIDQHPDVIVLGSGINDVATGQLSAAFLQQAALQGKAAGIKVIIVGPYRPGTAERLKAHGVAVDNFNADMLAFSKLHGFCYIDNTGPGITAGLLPDGVHPNAAGYALLASRIEAAL